jgi:hypothetical protein
MSRFKLVTLLCVVAVTLLLPRPVMAEDPDPTTCLPNCYAKNGISESGNGKKDAPWKAETIGERLALTKAVGQAVQEADEPGSLTIVVCDTFRNCTQTVYKYTVNQDANATMANQTAGQPMPGDPTTSGVPLPLPYLLGAGMLLGVLLIGSGITLRRRALRLNA